MTTTTAYAEIAKAERNTAGDLVVVGKATGPDLDSDRQVCDPMWLAKAMPAWMSSGGNIREQHSAIAAGVATELAKAGDSWMVTATVVDPISAAKVEKGVLKGFSIGINAPQITKDAGAPGGRIVGGHIVEVSLVDRPANPTCTLTLAKAAKPGVVAKAGDLDAEHMLVKVEELTETPPPAQPDVEQLVAAAVAKATAPLLAKIDELTKTREPDKPAPDPAPADKAEGTDLTGLVEAAVAKAIAPLQERLAKAMEQPAPGGPVLARPGADIHKADARTAALTKAAEYERLATEVADPAARTGYLQLAAEARAGAPTS